MPVQSVKSKSSEPSKLSGRGKNQPLPMFKSEFIDGLKKRLSRGDIDPRYADKGIKVDHTSVILSQTLHCPMAAGIVLKNPDEGADFQLKNSITVFRHFKNMTITEATDARIWTYLSHVAFWPYMLKFRPAFSQPQASRANYILRHYFVIPVNSKNLLLNDIALLWWGAYLTHDPEHKEDPFWLTAELFSMLDYTRHLLPGSQGRNRNFALAVMQFVAQNKTIFTTFKEAKVRFIMRKCNFIAGYKLFPMLSRQEIVNVISSYRGEIEKVKE